MGIKDLNPFIKANVPEAIEHVHFSKLSGKRVAIDTSIYFYKFLYKNDRYLESFFLQISKLLRWGIVPIYVFDGVPPKEKTEEIQQRIIKKNNIKYKIEELDKSVNDELDVSKKKHIYIEIAKLKKKLIYVKSEYIINLKYFLDLLNIKYIQSEGEADSLCSKLNKNNVVDMVMSDDMDLLTSGTKMLLRDYCNSSNNIYTYNVNLIYEKLGFDYDMWVDFCILCGCDYSKRIKGFGPNSIFKSIKEFKNIETIMNEYVGENKKYTNIPKVFNYEKSRELFKECGHYKSEYDSINVNVEPLFGNQIDTISNYLKKYTTLTDRMIKNKLEAIYK
jgi:flap endonuclease-1